MQSECCVTTAAFFQLYFDAEALRLQTVKVSVVYNPLLRATLYASRVVSRDRC